jgi:hypothetical protein
VVLDKMVRKNFNQNRLTAFFFVVVFTKTYLGRSSLALNKKLLEEERNEGEAAVF